MVGKLCTHLSAFRSTHHKTCNNLARDDTKLQEKLEALSCGSENWLLYLFEPRFQKMDPKINAQIVVKKKRTAL
jgi:hypothetical protein